MLLFALCIAIGIPSPCILPGGIWKVTGLREVANRAMGEGGVGWDYVVTVRKGFHTQTINLGETMGIWDHQLPQVGGYVLLRNFRLDTGGVLPITVIETLPRHIILGRIVVSATLSAVLVFVGERAYRLAKRLRKPVNSTRYRSLQKIHEHPSVATERRR